jgi:flagellar export protein FliJ
MQTHSLTLLMELATTARDAALAQRGQLQQRVAQAAEQLDVLRGYARDYGQRSRAQLAAGCDPAAQLNFRAFAIKLDQAVAAQENELRAREQQLAAGEQELQRAQRRLRSLQALAERREAAARVRAQRIDQKRTDEIARTARLSANEW